MNINQKSIKESLIKTMHNSKKDEVFFERSVANNNEEVLRLMIKIVADQDDFGDSPIAASYYIKEYSHILLRKYESELVKAFTHDERNARTMLAIALGKIKAQSVKNIIYKNATNEEDINKWMYEEAVKYYEE